MARLGPVACSRIPGLRVHVAPKCGSDSVTRAMQGCDGFSRERVDQPSGEFRFGLVRNPLERLVSGWAYFCRDGRLNNQQQLRQIGYRHGMPFDAFLEVAFTSHWMNQHTRRQADFIGPQPFDRMARTENLTAEWAALRMRFPQLRPVGHHNRSTHGDWREHYSRGMRRRAETIYAADMELYEGASDAEELEARFDDREGRQEGQPEAR